jgi:hypothetical protein
MYADDLLLLALSLRDLQLMVNACSEELVKIDMKPNAKKAACLRIGDRVNVKLTDVLIDQLPIPWSQELQYLGLVLCSGKKLKYDFHAKKAKYFGAVNSVLGKIGVSNNASLVLSIMVTKCSPILQYNLEAITMSKESLSHLCFVSNAIYAKIFKTFDKSIIAECQWQFGHLPLSFELDLKRMNFLHKLLLVEHSPAHLMLKLVASDELPILCNKYGIQIDSGCTKRKEAVWNAFCLLFKQ